MKKIVVVIMSSLLLFACSESGTQSQDSSAEDNQSQVSSSELVDSYISNMQNLSETESDLINRYESVAGENYTDDLTMYNEVTSLVPDVQTFIAELEAIPLGTDELRRVHEIYIEAWNTYAQGLTLLLAALDQQDYSLAAEANDALSQGRALMRDYIAEVQDL